MYEVDERDRVIELEDVPQSDAGAPVPSVVADEFRVVLAYCIQEPDANHNAGCIQPIARQSFDDFVAVVRFSGCTVHMFGPPNDEAFAGHPLANRGLHPYGAFRIENSSWIRKLERMNSVHSYHRPEKFWGKQHLVFAFHDSTFECVCGEFDVKRMRGSTLGLIPDMAKLLERHL